jgi:hypothetical protein
MIEEPLEQYVGRRMRYLGMEGTLAHAPVVYDGRPLLFCDDTGITYTLLYWENDMKLLDVKPNKIEPLPLPG